MSIYDDFIKQIRDESNPPEGAFTHKQLMEDAELSKNQARTLLQNMERDGKIKAVGKFPGGKDENSYPCIWYVIIK